MSTEIFTLEAMIENLKQEKKRIEEEDGEKAYIAIGDHYGDLSIGFNDDGVFHYGNYYYGGIMEGIDLRKVKGNMSLLGSMIVFESGLTEEAKESAVSTKEVIESYQEEEEDDSNE